jgi:hypothetical protein
MNMTQKYCICKIRKFSKQGGEGVVQKGRVFGRGRRKRRVATGSGAYYAEYVLFFILVVCI